jgi:esterase/lipase superfamily enzyme
MGSKAGRTRWLLIAGSHALVGVLAAIAGAQLMKQWVPGYSTPERAQFPRRVSALAGAADVHRFYFATTRPAGTNLLDDEAPQRSEGLSLGTFDVRISPTIRVDPLVWMDRESLDVQGTQQLEPDAFFEQVKSASERSPHRSVLIIVWGWKERWLTAAAKSAYVARMLDIDTPVIVFDWPANQGSNARGYLASRRVAHLSGADLGRFLESVIGRVQPENLWLISMSMGAQVVTDAFDYMDQRRELSDADKEIAHVILAAPDVPANEFDHRFAAQLRGFSRHLTVYVSSTDQALLLSQWVHRESRVGRVPKARPEDVDPEFVIGSRLLTLKAAGRDEIEVVDVTPVNRNRNRHNFLTDDPLFLDELYVRLLRPGDPTNRRLYPVRAQEGMSFWILWGD